MIQTLDKKKILITGGTSRLGECFVREAIAAGAEVFFTWKSEKEKAESLIAAGAEGFCLDLADMKAVEKFAEVFEKKTGSLDILIHNAAAVRDKLLRDMEEEDWDQVVTVDLKAPFYLTQKLLKSLQKSALPKIFVLISRAAHLGAYGASNYAAAKAGLVGLVKSLAQEWGSQGILINAVNPGFMLSRMTENLGEAYLEKNKEASPLEKFSDPREVARFLTYLCSDSMKQVTGQIFHFESRRIPF